MRRTATIIALVCGIAISLCTASTSSGKIVARWHSSSYEAKFAARKCGGPFKATRTFPSTVKRLKLRQPAVGVNILDPKGNRVAKVSSVKVRHLRGGGWKVVWKATPGIVCPKDPEEIPYPQPVTIQPISKPTLTYPTGVLCVLPSEEALPQCQEKKAYEAAWARYWEEVRAQEQSKQQLEAANQTRWEEETAAQQREEKEFRATWAEEYQDIREYPYARTQRVHFAYKFFTRKNVVQHPAPTPEPCLLVCEAEHALARTLREHYEMAQVGSSCHQLTAKKVHCYFSGLTREDIRNGNLAGHKGDAYVTKFPDGFDVQIVSFYPG